MAPDALPVLMPVMKPLRKHSASKATAGADKMAEAAQDLFPIEAHIVFTALSDDDKGRLRQMARQVKVWNPPFGTV